MGFFTELLLLPLAPVRGVGWVAEQIGNEMAKGDGVGIAKQLAKSRYSDDAAAAQEG